jgi:uncharacterized membrane protein YgdD (TMEM256/DUF423 family)
MVDLTPKAARMSYFVAGLWGAWGVAMLALGGHAPQAGIATTAGQFLLLHAAAVMAVAQQTRFGGVYLRAAVALLLVGSGLFAAEIAVHMVYGQAVAGPLAPIGGGAAILGWLCIAIGALRGEKA